MQFPRSTHVEHLMSRDADAISPPLHSRRFHAAAMLVAVAALAASAGLDMVDDPRPLDVQLTASMHKAAETLRGWQDLLSRGLQVSLRAVADGREAAAPAASAPADETVLALDASRDQPVRADVAPRQLQPTR
ncbi:hypothetical protein ACS5PN_29295 [Roseateles sp. NT4]|uniref:hypothetical protein n=1 Tax=Roseateles sp. NT4 TaxID=3453715 RepID=UPI003EEA6355